MLLTYWMILSRYEVGTSWLELGLRWTWGSELITSGLSYYVSGTPWEALGRLGEVNCGYVLCRGGSGKRSGDHILSKWVCRVSPLKIDITRVGREGEGRNGLEMI